VQFIRSLEQEYQVSLFDRTELAFNVDGAIKVLKLNELPQAVSSGGITESTPYFDNLVTTAGDLQQQWLKPSGSSWLRKYF
jgi:hypothetical protein